MIDRSALGDHPPCRRSSLSDVQDIESPALNASRRHILRAHIAATISDDVQNACWLQPGPAIGRGRIPSL